MSEESVQRKKRGVSSRKELYAKIAPFAELAIDTLIDLMKKGNTDAIRLGAAKVILNKILPDQKAQELSIDRTENTGVVILPTQTFSS